MVGEVLRRMLLEIALGRHLAIAERQEHVALVVERDLAAEVAAALRHRLEQLLDVGQPIVFEARANQRGGRRRWFLRAGRRRITDLLRVGDVQQPIGGEVRMRRHFEQAALALDGPPEAAPRPAFGSSLPLRTMRRRPGRSVISVSPPGRNAIDQGCTRPSANVTTR